MRGAVNASRGTWEMEFSVWRKWCPLLTAAWRTTAAATPKPHAKTFISTVWLPNHFTDSLIFWVFKNKGFYSYVSAKTGGVFHLRSPEGKYKLNSSKAEEACKAEGATLATFKQLSDAQQVTFECELSCAHLAFMLLWRIRATVFELNVYDHISLTINFTNDQFHWRKRSIGQ